VPPFDPNTPEGQAEMDKIKTAYHDVILQSLEAKNAQEQAAAKYNYDLFKKEINKNYNIALSDNATEAWGQISGLGDQAQQRGIYGSGIIKEMRDKYLASVRKTDDRLRQEKLTKEDEEKRQYYLNNATPEEINALSQEEKEKFGLVPDAETAAFFNMDNLKSLYPDTPESELQLYADSIIENGNYKSKLYQQLFSNKFLIQEGMGFGDIIEGEGIKDIKLEKAKEAAALKEEKAYAPYTKAGIGEKRYEQVAKEGKNYGDILTTSTGQKINPVDPNYDTYAKEIGVTIPVSTQQPVTTTPTSDSSQWSINKESTKPVTPTPITPPATDVMKPFTDWTTGKSDVLGKNWQGYTDIPGEEYQTEEQKKKWQNTQQVGNTLYGYKGI